MAEETDHPDRTPDVILGVHVRFDERTREWQYWLPLLGLFGSRPTQEEAVEELNDRIAARIAGGQSPLAVRPGGRLAVAAVLATWFLGFVVGGCLVSISILAGLLAPAGSFLIVSAGTGAFLAAAAAAAWEWRRGLTKPTPVDEEGWPEIDRTAKRR